MGNLIILFDNIDQKPAIEKQKQNGLEIRYLWSLLINCCPLPLGLLRE